MAFHPHFVPNFLDFAIRSNQKSATHDSFENPAHEFLRSPHSVCFDHFVGWIAEQRKIQLLFLLEARKRFFRVGARTQDRYILFVEVLLCVTKLGRFRRSTWRVGFGEEEQHYPFSLEITQRHIGARIALKREVRCLVSYFQHEL
jgi:hypothetical protein